MIEESRSQNLSRVTPRIQPLGTLGYSVVFLWSLAMVFVSGIESILFAGGCVLGVQIVLNRRALTRMASWRWVVFGMLLVLPPALWISTTDAIFMGIPFSRDGAYTGLVMLFRAVVVLASIDTLTRTIDITEISGLLERIGLKGLGFSIGVAMNFFPLLTQSSQTTWNCLRLRGGLRSHRFRTLGLCIVTILGNALRRAEDIALAAEARAFSPEGCHPAPLRRGVYDFPVVIITLISFFVCVIVL